MPGRVRRLERARAPVLSPISVTYDSFDAFAAECEALMGGQTGPCRLYDRAAMLPSVGDRRYLGPLVAARRVADRPVTNLEGKSGNGGKPKGGLRQCARPSGTEETALRCPLRCSGHALPHQVSFNNAAGGKFADRVPNPALHTRICDTL